MKIKQYKLARRLGVKLFSKTQNPKFVLAKKNSRDKRPAQLTEYGMQLIEKQKMRYSYNLSERQFGTYVKKATLKKGVNPAEYLYKNLESRLDSVVYSLGLAKTRPLARQMVSHGHITVNGRRVNIPAFSVKAGDAIGVREQSKNRALFTNIAEPLKSYTPPGWLALDAKNLEGKVLGVPQLNATAQSVFNITSVIGFYSR